MLNIARNTFPFLLWLSIYYIKNTDGSSRYLPWPNANKIIKLMCPATDVCDVKATSDGLGDPCCTECFCGDECIDGFNCCFRDNIKEDYETCLYLSSKFNTFFAFTPLEASALSYYVVTQSPTNGCHNNKGVCDSSDTSLIYPGYSQTTRKVYFNKDCAICHGVDDFEEAVAYFFCDELGSSKTLNFDEEISKFLDGDKSSLCFFSFDITIPTGISHRACSIHATESINSFIDITNKDHLSSRYNMSLDDITSACISTLFSPTFSESKKKLYPNPFCYLLGEGTHKTEQCFQASGNPTGIHFFVLINTDVKDDIRLDAIRHNLHLDRVCILTETSQTHQFEGCRPVSCPIGHIINKTGICTLFGYRIFDKGRMNIYLNLLLRRKGIGALNNPKLLNLTIDDIEKYTQLPVDWRIAFWGISAHFSIDSMQSLGDILLILELISADLPKGVESIKQYINTDVAILDEMYEVSIYSKKLEFKDIYPDDVLEITQCSTAAFWSETQEIRKRNPVASNVNEIPQTEGNVSLDRNISNTIQSDGVPDCWKMIAFSVFRYNTLSVVPLSKLYFCNLVQLMNGEYRLFANDSILFNEIRGVYLHASEFLVQHKENGGIIVKVCLEGSGLGKLVVSASFKHSGQHRLVLLIVIMFFHQGLINLSEI